MPTHFISGLSDAPQTSMFADMPVLRPDRVHSYFNDFLTFNTADWTITTTEAGAGDATEALTDEQFGALLITNDAADNDADFFQKKGESFKFVSGKKLAFACRFKVSDATQSDVVVGLQITDTTPLAVTDGVYWRKDDGDANLDFVVMKDSTATTATAATTLADATYITLGFLYNGTTGIEYWSATAAGVWTKLGTSVTTNMPDDELLTISFGIQNGEAVAKTMTVDWIYAAVER